MDSLPKQYDLDLDVDFIEEDQIKDDTSVTHVYMECDKAAETIETMGDQGIDMTNDQNEDDDYTSGCVTLTLGPCCLPNLSYCLSRYSLLFSII